MRDLVSRLARIVLPIGKVQQVTNLVDLEAEIPTPAYKAEPPEVLCCIIAVVACLPYAQARPVPSSPTVIVSPTPLTLW
jgi:hypothetical protein